MEKKNRTSSAIVSYRYGSIVYGTDNENSDEDMISIISDDFEDMTENEGQGKIGDYDITFYKESYFIEKIKNHSIDALELIVLLDKEYGIRLADPKQGKAIFESVETMAAYIAENRTK